MTTENATRNFQVLTQARTYIQNLPALGSQKNELKIAEWNPSEPKTLPIEAFFYLMDSKTGHDTAIRYQKEYFHQTLEMLPIVKIQLRSVTDLKFKL